MTPNKRVIKHLAFHSGDPDGGEGVRNSREVANLPTPDELVSGGDHVTLRGVADVRQTFLVDIVRLAG